MAKFITRRILLGILTLFAVSVIVFVATQALPGQRRPGDPRQGRHARRGCTRSSASSI